MRPDDNLPTLVARCRGRLCLIVPAAAIVAASAYMAAQLLAADSAEPRRLDPVADAQPLASVEASTREPQPFSAQQVEHRSQANDDGDVPSYLRPDTRNMQPLNALEEADHDGVPNVVSANDAADGPTITVPRIDRAEVKPEGLPSADALPELPGGPSFPSMHHPLQKVPSYQSVLPQRSDTDEAAMSPYPAVTRQVTPPRPRMMPQEVYAGDDAEPVAGTHLQGRFGHSPPQAPAARQPAKPARPADLLGAQADSHVKAAFSLAERGALYSAKSELIQALRLVTQSLDAAEKTNKHGQALAAGLRALAESQDFVPRGTQLEADLDLPGLITSHRTPMLKEAASDPQQLASLTPMNAVQQYLLYAQQQLTVACGGTQAGSLSLYGLGRLQMAMAGLSSEAPQRRHPQAMTLYQAAVATDNSNFLAANELGVMLARYGRLEAAKEMLQLASRGMPRAETWHNLAAVHEKLGERELATLARQEFVAAKTRQQGRLNFASQHGLSGPEVTWVSPDAFAKQKPGPAPSTAPAEEKAPSVSQRQQQAESDNAASWLTPWKTTKR